MTEAAAEDALRTIRIAIIGAGTIGLSFVVLHLTRRSSSPSSTRDHRWRSAHVRSSLSHEQASKVRIAQSLEQAVKDTDIVQEQGPENVDFKSNIWPEIERHASTTTLRSRAPKMLHTLTINPEATTFSL